VVSWDAAPRLVDWGLAALATAAALAYAQLAMSKTLAPADLVVCAAATGAIGVRRSHPPTGAAIVLGAMIVYSAVTVQPMPAPVVAAPALIFYSLGRSVRGSSDQRRQLVLAALLACGLGVALSGRHSAGVSAIGAWLAFLLLPAAAGLAVAGRGELHRQLETIGGMLERSAALLAKRAVGAERDRVARELHDVVAHTVSLMVIQASAAREVLERDRQGAREAIAVVSGSGREALAELRRMVGALPADESELGGPALPCLARMDELVERARRAGLEVEAALERPPAPLAAGVELTAYRLLQEALTNILKHAGPVRASVQVRARRSALEIDVTNTGGRVSDRAGEPGHGLAGMQERVAIYGGRLSAGPLVDGGFSVSAWIPLDVGPMSDTWRVSATDTVQTAPAKRNGRAARWGWLDPTVNALLLGGFGAEALAGIRRGPLVVELIAAAFVPAAVIWRRRLPLLLMAVVAGLSLPMVWTPTPTGLYAMLVPPYSVGAWGSRRQAILGFAGWAAAETFSGRVTSGDGTVGDILSPIAISAIGLAVGMAMRGYRLRATELELANTELARQREGRARMAVADERARIARELHVAIARDVATMVVQAEAASVLLDKAGEADRALAAIVATGRPALAEMRRIVGVMRHAHRVGDQPDAVDAELAVLK
jgi:signal transduction histidine kinase